MTEVLEQQREETASVETTAQLPADTATPPTDDRSVEDLLAEFDERTTRQAELEPSTASPDAVTQDASTDQSVDQQLADLLGTDPKVAELQGQLNDLRIQMHRQEEMKAFESLASDLHKQMPSWVPPDYTKAKLEALAHDPELRLAWDTRNIDPKAAALDLAHVTHALNQLKGDPNADPKQVQELNKLAYQLNVAAHSHSILRQVRNNILNEAKKLPPPIDEDATALRAEIAFQMKQGQGPTNIPDPPVNWGRLSGREFREKVIKDHGFDPGTW